MKKNILPLKLIKLIPTNQNLIFFVRVGSTVEPPGDVRIKRDITRDYYFEMLSECLRRTMTANSVTHLVPPGDEKQH